MKDNKLQLTKQGVEALKNELSDLLEKKRPNLVERLSNARGQGDLSENSDYQNAKDELEFLDGRIDELREVIKNSVIIKDTSADKDTVGVGTKVKLHINGNENIFEIVGEWEADPVAKKISHTSPLGQALMGKKIGDGVEVEAPAGKLHYEIISIE
ncbi:MAG: Transcription elongation factor GreA [Candidatus Woesebacteria bacterium GW2011_GWB1_38_5]|uniref:Transcription elongation factor GreA n=4 Tax=Candidatus Woeseibacteriota TaxID=1752722 RepID=A0A0G0JZW6_9BACT|nr:MAG: Transcription elongation factor GreA [Candidatus Woesebacteria bacterium GW2011_GWD1_38_10]KKQ55196.1 MAG: Transcription elongation factor GreA [Candidatus Woesebacteria bacterium GW2011_GWC1_38_13]KKQ73033.1 MAG: Transcription elongation factor GreA [Candidatus Woesebacteria bacterium GW2011_GWB1_38_5]KKQ83360.1 MAG: Transcription elongation factor GreA [Candidatus Woesebacteria bacterium GW2011_GWA1_38_8]